MIGDLAARVLGPTVVGFLPAAVAAAVVAAAVWGHGYATAAGRYRATAETAALRASLAAEQEKVRRITAANEDAARRAQELAASNIALQLRLEEFNRAAPPPPAQCRDADRVSDRDLDALRKLRGEPAAARPRARTRLPRRP